MIIRLFAQLLAFRYCCPSCGTLNTIYHGQRHQKKGRYNRITGQIRCEGCQKVYWTGLLLWPRKPRDHKRIGGHPDTSPTLRELALIRQEYAITQVPRTDQGRFVPVRKGKRDLVNRIFEEEPGEAELAEVEPDEPESAGPKSGYRKRRGKGTP